MVQRLAQMVLSIGSTTKTGNQIPHNGFSAQSILDFQGMFSQLFRGMFVARMIGWHTGRR